MKEGLLSEGLRIAQQYGLTGLAEELKDSYGDLEPGEVLQRHGERESEQDLWNQEVEQDRIKQEQRVTTDYGSPNKGVEARNDLSH